MKIFLPVGSRFPMDRLVSLVDEYIGEHSDISCIAQIGDSQYLMKNGEAYHRLEQQQFTEYAKNSDVIISHAGVGNIALAAKLSKPVIVMARQGALQEHINDHQISTLKGLQHKEFIYAIEDRDSLKSALQWASQWILSEDKQSVAANVELVNYIKHYMRQRDHGKVLAVSSAGGHWTQLQMLQPILDNYDVTFMTTSINSDLRSNRCIVTVCDADISRKFKLLLLGMQSFFYMLKIRPDIVISTGAAPGFFAVMFAKLFKKKTIWLDSIANYEQLSISGKYVKPFSDVFLVQWPHLAHEGLYKGALI